MMFALVCIFFLVFLVFSLSQSGHFRDLFKYTLTRIFFCVNENLMQQKYECADYMQLIL